MLRNRIFNAASSALGHLQLLYRLRWLALLGQLITIATTSLWLDIRLPLLPLLGIVAAHFLFNLATCWQIRRIRSRRTTLGSLQLPAQIVADIAVLTLLLYFAGGAANPFVSLYLLPISIAAAILPAGAVIGLLLLTLLCYSGLMLWHVPLPHIHAFGHDQFWGHQIGMWLTFVIAAAVMVWFLLQAATMIRQRDQQLRQAREKALRNEHILSLATLSASTAHELGTPLATLTLLADELRHDPALPAAMLADLQLMQEQIARMKRLLGELSGRASAQQQEQVGLRQWLERLVDEWRLLRPAAQLQLRANIVDSVTVASHGGLEKALQNLLNNAADVSPAAVELAAGIDGDWIELHVLDRGPGVAPEVAELAGGVPVSTKAEGLGIGLLLTHATIEQLGGEVALFDRPGGGADIRVRLPRQQMEMTT
ncbi:MAG: ATP-binding protein [Chitinivorax sp.]